MTERDVKWRPYQPPPVILNQPKDQAGSTSPKIPDAPLPPKYPVNLAHSLSGSIIPVRQSSSGNGPVTVDQNHKISFSNSEIKDPVKDHDTNYYRVTIKDQAGKEKNLLIGKEGTKAQGFALQKVAAAPLPPSINLNPRSTQVNTEKTPVQYTAHKLENAQHFYDDMKKLRFDSTGAKYLGLVGKQGNQYEKFQLPNGKNAYIGNDPKNKNYGYQEGEDVKKIAEHTTTQLKNQIPKEVIAKREEAKTQKDLAQLKEEYLKDPQVQKQYKLMQTANMGYKMLKELGGLVTDPNNVEQIMNPEKPALTKEQALRKLGEEIAIDPNRALAGLLHHIETDKKSASPDAVAYAKDLIDYHHTPLDTREQQSLQKNVDRLMKLDPAILKAKFPEYYEAQQNWKVRLERGGEFTALDKSGPDGMLFYNLQFNKVCIKARLFSS